MTDHPHTCPACGAPALVLLTSVECSAPGCEHYVAPEFRVFTSKGSITVPVSETDTAEMIERRAHDAIQSLPLIAGTVLHREMRVLATHEDGRIVLFGTSHDDEPLDSLPKPFEVAGKRLIAIESERWRPSCEWRLVLRVAPDP